LDLDHSGRVYMKRLQGDRNIQEMWVDKRVFRTGNKVVTLLSDVLNSRVAEPMVGGVTSVIASKLRSDQTSCIALVVPR
jgi:hypothetical protein